jgi:hypothetical protein
MLLTHIACVHGVFANELMGMVTVFFFGPNDY